MFLCVHNNTSRQAKYSNILSCFPTSCQSRRHFHNYIVCGVLRFVWPKSTQCNSFEAVFLHNMTWFGLEMPASEYLEWVTWGKTGGRSPVCLLYRVFYLPWPNAIFSISNIATSYLNKTNSNHVSYLYDETKQISFPNRSTYCWICSRCHGMEIKKCFSIYARLADIFGLDILTFCRVRHSNQIKLQCILLE